MLKPNFEKADGLGTSFGHKSASIVKGVSIKITPNFIPDFHREREQFLLRVLGQRNLTFPDKDLNLDFLTSRIF